MNQKRRAPLLTIAVLFIILMLLVLLPAQASENHGYKRLLDLISGTLQEVNASILVDSSEVEVYGVQDATLISADGVTTTQTSGLVTRSKTSEGAYIVWDIGTVVSSTTNMTLTIDAYDPASAGYVTLYTMGPYTSAQTLTWLFYPGATDTGSALTGIVEVPLPARYRAQVATNSNVSRTMTYTLGVSYVQ